MDPSRDEAEAATLARLRAREALLTEAEGIARVGSFVWEPGVRSLWSDEFFRLLGCEPGQLEPHDAVFFGSVHPEDLPRVQAAAAQAGRGVAPEIEYRIVRRDNGETRHIRGSGIVYRNPDGSVQKVIGALLDITQAKHSALALEQALTVSRAVEDMAHTGSFVVRLDPPELSVSEGLRKLTGLPEGPIDACKGIALVHPDERPDHLAWWARLLRDRQVEPLQTRITTPDGQIRHLYTRATFTPFLADGAVRVVGTTVDITERVELEAELQRAATLEAVGSLAAGVAHDFNNFLSVVGSTLEQLPRADVLARERLIDNAQRAVTRCAELTRQLLGFARCQPFKAAIIDVCSVVDEMQGLFRQSLGRRAALQVQRPARSLYARLDARHLEQMLANLLVNAADAIEASRQGQGEVRIIADELQLTAALQLQPDAVPAGHYTRICVEDDGGGVAPEVLPRIFEPYFTTKPRGRGTGLGLSAVYGTVHQNGGVVTVEALPRGTRFALWFPKAEPPPLRAAGDAEPRPFRILIVDDVPELVKVTSALLREAGYETVLAPGAPEALTLLGAHQVDLVLSDIQMPVMDGYKLASEIRTRHPGLPVVLMTGHAGAPPADEPKPAVLSKPFSSEELVAFVSAALV